MTTYHINTDSILITFRESKVVLFSESNLISALSYLSTDLFLSFTNSSRPKYISFVCNALKSLYDICVHSDVVDYVSIVSVVRNILYLLPKRNFSECIINISNDNK